MEALQLAVVAATVAAAAFTGKGENCVLAVECEKRRMTNENVCVGCSVVCCERCLLLSSLIKATLKRCVRSF